ncbi:MAG TPA: TonB family protein [Cellvibrionaceae bacterium]
MGIIALAVLATLGLLYLMMILINTDYEVEEPEPPTIIANIDMPKPPDEVATMEPPMKPVTKEPPENLVIEDNTVITTGPGPKVTFPPPTPPGPVNTEGPVLDTGIMPIVQVAPVYPRTALRQGLEGYVTLEFTVTTNGSTRDIRVVEALTAAGESTTVFNRAAIAALEKFKYKPQVVDGVAVEKPGERTRLVFEMQDS